jgi:hypothetical protein
LEIEGSIPSFKNRKRMVGPHLRTDRKVKARMREIEADFASQLLSDSKIGVGETSTVFSLRSAIASSIPEDDCWTQLPEIIIRAEFCQQNPGATIIIERIE